MNLIAWVVLGLLAGAIAKAIVPGHQGGGWLSTLVLGVIGSFIGGFLLTFIQTGSVAAAFSSTAPFSIAGVAVAVLGAIIAIYLYGLVASRNY